MEAKKKGRGRPKTTQPKREKQLFVKLTEAEMEALSIMAEEAGKEISTFVRNKLFGNQ